MLLRGIKKDKKNAQKNNLTFQKTPSFPNQETFTDDEKYRDKEEKTNEKQKNSKSEDKMKSLSPNRKPSKLLELKILGDQEEIV